jgi:glycosyltransferase involved in cell wall biosynthesis
MKETTVGVVIPYFNGSRWIQRALDSVYDQTRLPDEVIIVNDGSSTEETEFIEELAATFGIKLLSQKNKGQSSARNVGVSASKSEYVCLLDQDDYFLPRHIEILLRGADLDNPDFSFAYGDLQRVSESGRLISRSCIHVKNNHPLTSVEVMLRNNMYILPSAALIKRSAFLFIGGFDENLKGYEDDDLFLRFFMGGFTNSFIPDTVSAWTVNVQSTSYTEAMSRSRFLYFSKLYEKFVLDSSFESQNHFRIFRELLFPRFSPSFANDVVSSSLGKGEHFNERVERLERFRQVVRQDSSLRLFDRNVYLLGTLPLVILGQTSQRRLLRLLLAVLERFTPLKVGVLKEFVRLHSTLKKSID